jgi:3-(3-hydroxy-phenyl)propionate hydroxylase
MYEFGRRPTGEVDRAVPAGLIEMEDPEGAFFAWLRASRGRDGSVAIVRPDKFVFGLVPARELAAATREAAKQLERSPVGQFHRPSWQVEPAMKEAA